MKKITIKPKSFFKVLESTPRSQVAEMVLSSNQSTGGPSNNHPRSDQWLFVVDGKSRTVKELKTLRPRRG